jgi:anthranilate synthase/aminodeoxychorismate synthase-like glutamine amidotransferase
VIAIIDNYDSFTWNLVHRIGEIDRSLEVRVFRNDAITPEDLKEMRPSAIVISPGPCTPAQAGVSCSVVTSLAGVVPILGVCLGHQCIGAVNQMTVERHVIPVHGKTSPIHHDGTGLFNGLPNPFEATRYHSLVVRESTIPNRGWTVSAWTFETDERGEPRRVVMGLRREWEPTCQHAAPLDGVQFHPESFLTTAGPKLLENFLDAAHAWSVGTTRIHSR